MYATERFLMLVRILFILSSIVFFNLFFTQKTILMAIIYSLLVAGLALITIIILEFFFRSFHFQQMFWGFIGLFIGVAFAYLINPVIKEIIKVLFNNRHFCCFASYLTYHILGFSSMLFFAINSDEINSLFARLTDKRKDRISISAKVLDTSAIIDGRIADIVATQFIEGIIYVPNFILKELQMIADASDNIKRNRGRRGLEILAKMQKDKNIKVQIIDEDYPDIKEVDMKLIKFAILKHATIITTDYNLIKVAQLRGVKILNVNDLVNALKTVVMHGEELKVHIIKHGKDITQGVGYLEDGTMVVIEGGGNYIGKTVPVIVTTIHQTSAGRMIFAKLKEQ